MSMRTTRTALPAGPARVAAPGRPWTPRAAAGRARDVLAHDGVRTLWFKLLGETVYRRLALVECPLAELPPLRDAPLAAEYGFLSETDALGYTALRGYTTAAEVVARLRRGDRCFAAWSSGRLVSARWIARGETHVEYLGRTLRLRPDEVYLYETYTRPDHRGLGLSAAAGTRLLHALAAEGVACVVAGVMPESHAAVRAWQKAGYRRVGTIGYVRLGPLRREFIRRRRQP